VLKHPRLALLLVLSLCATASCSRSDEPEHAADDLWTGMRAKGNDASIREVRAAAHALAQPQPSVDYVAAEMEGVIKARTKSHALMHYDGYRATLTTPADRVTQITFQLIEAKPSVGQLTEAFGEPREVRKGMLYEYESAATGSTILILAEPVSMPADEGSLVSRIIIEGKRTR
jgi:hypothetical protein